MENGNKKKIGFTRRLFHWLRNYFAAVGVFAFVFPLFIASFINFSIEKSEVSDLILDDSKTYELHLDLHGPIAEQSPQFQEIIFSGIFGEDKKVYLPQIKSTLRKAAADKRISQINLVIGSISGTLAEISELRRYLERFKKDSGKPIHTILESPTNWLYALATVSDSITINPTSSLFIPGPAFNLTYFGDAVRKLGADLEVVKVGEFKSAFEMFVQNRPSAASLEQYEAMEIHLRQYLTELIADGRQKPIDLASSWLKQGIYSAEQAISEGLIDHLGYESSWDQDKMISFQAYANATTDDEDPMESSTGSSGIGLIEAVGEIHMDGRQDPDRITPRKIIKQLRWAAKEDDVKAIVLRISSPGGSAVASDMIWDEVMRLKKTKPVIVSMGGVAASGGYYIASPANHIIAEPTTFTGSIGVISMIGNLKPAQNKYGVNFYVVTQSERANMLNAGEKSSSFDRQLLAHSIEKVYETFIERVAAGRGISADEVDKVGRGRVYTGLEALNLGLVDELGGLHEAFQVAKRLAKLDENKLYPILKYKGKKESLMDCLQDSAAMFDCMQMSGALLRELRTPNSIEEIAQNQALKWYRFFSSEPALAVWPGYTAGMQMY